MLKPAVFLDRDGVLVKPVLRDGIPFAPLRWEDFEILRGAADAVRTLHSAGFLTIVVTNQPEVRRGTLDPALLEAFHQRLREAMPLDDIRSCCHDDRDQCECRKPKPGMILDGARRHGADLARSYIVGDTDRDVEAARAAGVPLILIDAPYNRSLAPNHRVPDLAAAARLILRLSTGRPAPPPMLS